MLKIHSFLRTMKDKEKHFEKGIQYKHSKRIAIVAYVLAAILLVSSFGDFHGLRLYSLEYMVNAATQETMEQETDAQGLVNQKNNAKLLETSLLAYPLGQLYQGELTKEDIETGTDDKTNTKVAIADQEEQIRQMIYDITVDPEDGDIVLFGLDTSEKEVTDLIGSIQFDAVAALASVSAEKERAEAIKEQQKGKENEKKSSESKKEKATATSSKSDVLAKTLNKKMIKTLSKDELDILYRIVEAEATGEDIYGKILVANVVLNRVSSKKFPNTVEKVVFQKSGNTYQFSPTKDGRFWSVKITDETMEAVSRALEGEDYSNGALYFFARKLTSNKKASWFDNSLRKVLKYGCHEFYKDK